MIKNYFKTTWRNFKGNIGFSIINIVGLAMGLTVTLIIGLWVHEQYNYDRFLPNYDRSYRVQRNFDNNGDTLTFRTTSLKLAEVLRNQIPEIEYVAESDWMGSHGLMVGNKKLYLQGGQVGVDFLKIFRFPFIQGDAGSVFKDAYSIVLTASTAKALFGDENPIGKLVRFDNENNLKVTGVLKDVPSNSSIRFNFLVPFTYLDQTQPGIKKQRADSFGNNAFQTFVRLKAGVQYAAVYPKIREIEHTEKGNNNAMNSYITLQPMKRWYLYSNYINGQDTEGFLVYVRLFTVIGVLVLLIACINFVNLTTAKSERRAKEVGVRKVIGSRRRELILQFMFETLFFTSIAFVLAFGLLHLIAPSFNTLSGGEIAIPYSNGYFWLILLVLILLTTLVAGSRPAFYLSSFTPIKVLKGNLQTTGSASLFRKVLVVVQFTCSVSLIIGTVIVYRQIQHAKERNMGYDLNRLLITNINGDLPKNYTALRNELLQKNIVQSMTTATSPATNVYWHSDVEEWPGKRPGENIEMGIIITGEDYFQTLGMKLKEGRNFTGGQDTTSVIFNEAAIAQMRLKDPINQLINWQGRSLRIAGIVKDALMLSPFAPADPTMFLCRPEPQEIVLYKLAGQVKTSEAIAQLTTSFTKYNPAYPYSFTFEDENYAAKFRLEMLVGKLAGIFAVLAIFISCLGLFGLAAYMAQQRTKEIGIRKVLGASISQIWILLSRDFMVLVLISTLIASPLAFYFLHNWLQRYEYRIDIGTGVFFLAAILALLITILTISLQAIKAAMANPVKSLRTE